MIRVTWTGAAGLCFETEKETILIDPYYTRIGILTTLFAPIKPDTAAIDRHLAAGKNISAVIVSHTHSDHVLDVPYLAERFDGKLVGSQSLDVLMQINHIPQRTTICRGGEKIVISKTSSVTMIASTHGLVAFGKVPFAGDISPSLTLPIKARDYRVGAVFAPKLELDGTIFLHNGSPGFIDRELNGHRCDVLFLCVAGWKHQANNPERILELTQPQTIVLFHYDNFSKPHRNGQPTRRMPFLDMQGLVDRIKAHLPNASIIIPEIGETFSF